MANPSKLVGEYLAAMRRKVPTRYPVRWRWAKLSEGNNGECVFISDKGPRRFLIRISEDLKRQPQALWFVLSHEFAHAVCWELCERLDEDDHHPPDFWAVYGVIYGRVYMAEHGVRT